jgi:hypothetical protein
VVHLNELQDKYRAKGFEILAISNESRSEIEKFVSELEAKYPIVSESSDSMQAYGKTGYPAAFLIGPDGRVVWEGHPAGLTEATIEEHLASVRLFPDLPASLAAIGKSVEKEKYGLALKALLDLIAKEKVPAEDMPAAEKVRDWLEWLAASSLEAAQRDLAAGRFYEASLAYERVQVLFKGHEHATEAKALLADLLSDPDRKLEVKAGEKLADLLVEIADLTPKKALQALQPLLASKYENTAAGKRAAEMARELEAAVD